MSQNELTSTTSLFNNTSSEHFEEALNKYTLIFLSPKLEEEYLDSRTKTDLKQKIFEILMIITMTFVNGRVCIRMGYTIAGKNQTKIDSSYPITIITLMVISFALELTVFIFEFFRKIRGIFMCTIPYIAYLLLSFQVDKNTHKEPYLAPPIIGLMLLIMSTSHLYTYNWLVSVLCLFVDYIGILWLLSMLLYVEVYENLINYVLYTSTFILAGYSLYLKEYERRNTFYTKYLLQQNQKNMDKILQSYPDPIIGCKCGSLNFINKQFQSLNQNDQHLQNE